MTDKSRPIYFNGAEFDLMLRHTAARVFGRAMEEKPNDPETAARLWARLDRIARGRRP
jgi:truncated hemoglobin YjbI